MVAFSTLLRQGYSNGDFLNRHFPIFYAAAALGFLWAPVFASSITFTINAGSAGTTIPSQVYGSDQFLSGVTNPFYRQGGNRMTAYNWENNSSNAGTDYGPNHEDWYDVPNGVTPPGMPATTLTQFILGNNAIGADSLVTLQMAGYVSANGACNCVVTVTGAADAAGTYWKAVSLTGNPVTGPPNTSDNVVYMDEEMAYLIAAVGGAGTGGAKFYDLDNEPALWKNTHPLVHPGQPTCAEVSGKGITLAQVITAADPNAQVLGPVAYGWSEYVNNQSAPDSGILSGYNNGDGVKYLNYYLSQFASASSTAGHRLLHYLDVHWYPEATGFNGSANVRITNNDTSYGVAVARMEAPRSLWDSSYVESSWIASSLGNSPITLIQRLQAAVSQYYPGTGLSFSEYNYGSGEDISGGVAQADALGIFGQYGSIACRWDDGTADQYVKAAFKLYLNYDGAGSSFGNLSLPAASSSVSLGSVYAARSNGSPNKLWIVAINRDYPCAGCAVTDTGTFTVNNISAGQVISTIRSYRFDAGNSNLYQPTAPNISGGGFTDNLPGRSGTIYEISLGTPTPSPTPTDTPTPCMDGLGHTCTPTITPTPTSTPTVTSTPFPPSLLFPNPVWDQTPLSFYYNVDSTVDQVKVKIFTVAYRKVYEDDTLSTATGQNKYTLDWGQSGLNIANGLYYVVLYYRGGHKETQQVMKLLVQR